MKRENASNCTQWDLSRPILFRVSALSRWLRCRGSSFKTTRGAMFGVVRKERNMIICFETSSENCSTCLRMHRRKASLDHLPISIIVYTGTPARCISMAAPDRREWVPILCGSKPRRALPMEAHAVRSAASILCDPMVSSL